MQGVASTYSAAQRRHGDRLLRFAEHAGVSRRGPAEGAHRYREGHVYYDQDVIVVGGGNSAVDAALELHRWGARVTIVHFGDALDPNVKPWVRPDIEARLREGAITAIFGARLVEVRPQSAIVRKEAGGRITRSRTTGCSP
jgi:thioredoxin reductase